MVRIEGPDSGGKIAITGNQNSLFKALSQSPRKGGGGTSYMGYIYSPKGCGFQPFRSNCVSILDGFSHFGHK